MVFPEDTKEIRQALKSHATPFLTTWLNVILLCLFGSSICFLIKIDIIRFLLNSSKNTFYWINKSTFK